MHLYCICVVCYRRIISVGVQTVVIIEMRKLESGGGAGPGGPAQRISTGGQRRPGCSIFDNFLVVTTDN